jgi:RNA polymerase sigma factor (TIGR02999 family)
MAAPTDVDITQLLRELSRGQPDALNRLIPVVYGELRRVAERQLRHERSDHTLSPTALVHEVYLKLLHLKQVHWRNRAHFFAMAARLMRRILIDHARTRKREKRGGEAIRVPLQEALHMPVEQAEDLLALDEALTRLEAHNARQCRVVECRCFAGLSVQETAEALRTSVTTVKRDWAFSRAWLNHQLGGAAGRLTPADSPGGA